jgi:hypothetical protein
MMFWLMWLDELALRKDQQVQHELAVLLVARFQEGGFEHDMTPGLKPGEMQKYKHTVLELRTSAPAHPI